MEVKKDQTYPIFRAVSSAFRFGSLRSPPLQPDDTINVNPQTYTQLLTPLREEVATEAFGVLQQSLTKAVETLVGMLDGNDAQLEQLVCNDIINHVLKHKELTELEQRPAALEDSLSDRA